jgi:hypothetical protein
VVVDNLVLPACLDPNGSMAMIDRRAYDELCRQSDRIAKLRLSEPDIKSVECTEGASQAVVGVFQMDMQVGPCRLTGRMHVVEDLPIPMLVGDDVLYESGAVIDDLRGLLFAFPDKGWVEHVADCQTSGQVDDSVAAHVRCNEEEQLFD